MASSLELDDGPQKVQSLRAITEIGFDALAVGNIDAGGIEECHLACPIADRMHGKVNDTRGAVRDPVG